MTEHRKSRVSKRPLTSSAPVSSSARNTFAGEVRFVVPGAVNAEVVVALPSGLEVVAIVTGESVRTLELKAGRPVSIMIKASSVLLAVGEGIVSSARNSFGGSVTGVREGAVNGEVLLRLSGGEEMAAIVTNGSIGRLGLEPGVTATALVKASSVLLSVP